MRIENLWTIFESLSQGVVEDSAAKSKTLPAPTGGVFRSCPLVVKNLVVDANESGLVKFAGLLSDSARQRIYFLLTITARLWRAIGAIGLSHKACYAIFITGRSREWRHVWFRPALE